MCADLAGTASCPEEAEAAEMVNRYLAEEVARACKNNKTHSCFTSDFQAFKNSDHVKDKIKKGLKGLENFDQVGCSPHLSCLCSFSPPFLKPCLTATSLQVMRRLETAGGMMTYVYDICHADSCSAVYRGEHRDCLYCPRCGKSRFQEKSGKAKHLHYLPVNGWLGAAWADPDIKRWVTCPGCA